MTPVTKSVLSDADANAFDEKLDRDEGLIARAADRLHGEWRGDEIAAFAAAMKWDLITADDFAA